MGHPPTHGGTQEFLTAIEKNGFRDPIKEGLDPIADMYAQYVKDAVCSPDSCPLFYTFTLLKAEFGIGVNYSMYFEVQADSRTFPAFNGPIMTKGKIPAPKRHNPPIVPR